MMPTLADQMRRKLEAMRNRVTAKGAKFTSKVITQRTVWMHPTLGYQETKSSWIRSYAYDKYSQTLYMTVHTGKTYQWNGVPEALAHLVRNGLARCTTDDPTGKHRWAPGKYPSLGAAYWQYLAKYRVSVVATVPVNIRALMDAEAQAFITGQAYIGEGI
jgi:hypothetical protein